MRKFYISIILFLFLISCKEETRVNSISGRVNFNCDDFISSAEIALKANVGGSFSEAILLGGAVTGSAGTFNFTYELEEKDKGTADMILINEIGFQNLMTGVPLNVDHNLTMYINNVSTISINLSGNKVWQANDTLFYGLEDPNETFFRVQPSNGLIDTLSREVELKYEGGTESTFFYGIGKVDFDLAIEALTIPDSSYQDIPIVLEGCAQDERIDLIID